jgi:integrase
VAALAPVPGAPTTAAGLYLARASAASRPTLRYSLARIAALVAEAAGRGAPPASAEAFPWHELRHPHVSALRGLLEARCAPATANRHLAALRGVLAALFDLGQVDAGELERCRRAARSVRGDSARAGREITQVEVEQLLGAAASSRDRALVALALFGGLRRDELARLDAADADPATGEVAILGKGGKRRNVFLAERGLSALREWLAERGDWPGPLFTRRHRSGAETRGRLSRSGVWSVLRGVATAAGVERVTPHDYRRTYASALLDEGVDLPTVQQLMGHSDPQTTSRYDRRGDERKRAAAGALGRRFGGA